MTKAFSVHGGLVVMAFALILAGLLSLPYPVALASGLLIVFGLGLAAIKYRVRSIRPAIGWRALLLLEAPALAGLVVTLAAAALFRGHGVQFAAVSVLYFVRGANGTLINGSSTPPTTSQAASCYKQTAQVNMSDADTQALFTHNWGLDASAPTYFEPEILHYPQMMTANGTWDTALTFDVTNTNVVKINKPNFAQSGGTWIVTLRRPHSVGQ